MKRFLKAGFIFICLACILFGFLNYNCRILEVKNYSIYSSKVPPIFNGYKIAIITDFHSSDTYENISKKTKASDPDIIVVLGDLINQRDVDFSNAKILMENFVSIAPTYFVSGNHERWHSNEEEILNMIDNTGAVVLNGEIKTLEIGKSKIYLSGFHDMIYSDSVMEYDLFENKLGELRELATDELAFNILLMHRANYADYAADLGYDVILSGHTNGGQIGLPILREIILNKRGITSPYIKGYYRIDSSQLVVSSGLESKWYMPRFFNPTQVVVVTLYSM